MLTNPSEKYVPFPPIELHNRQWPSKIIEKAPIWLSTDLRDGNQAIFEPMNVATKMQFFKTLVSVGFKEIEVGFPAASQIDFNFVRQLIDHHQIPDDVTPMVMTQAREDLIAKTIASVKGAKRVIVHMYNATAPVWRDVVFGMTVEQVMQLIEKHVRYLKTLCDQHPETEWVLQYSPETFSSTELPVALQACNTAIREWNAGPIRPIIINLPTTVENATPNVFADQIEWMNTRLERREHVVLSVHPHNDRGTGVASAELAQMAGADRVEGCLFGNGERCGNVDIVTLAMNLYTQGIAPNLDFSDMNAIVRTVQECTQLPVHPRHPYAGDLVFTAFSGSHQDAIKKGFVAQANKTQWQVPYLPIDPADVGRSYDSVIRVNSQSGKGGIAYLMERDHGVVMPRRMQIEFSAVVQQITEQQNGEVTSQQLWSVFEHNYLHSNHDDWVYVTHEAKQTTDGQIVELTLRKGQTVRCFTGYGNGPIAACVDALNAHMEIIDFQEKACSQGADAQAMAIIEARVEGKTTNRFGVGVDVNTTVAAIKALLSASRHLGVSLDVDDLTQQEYAH